MMRSLWTAASGMVAQQTKIDTISNNLANVNTTGGFKKSRVDFQDLLYQTVKYAGTPSTAGGAQVPTGIQVGHGGVRTVATQRIFLRGCISRQTTRSMWLSKVTGFSKFCCPTAQWLIQGWGL